MGEGGGGGNRCNWQEAVEQIGQPRVHHHNHHNSLA